MLDLWLRFPLDNLEYIQKYGNYYAQLYEENTISERLFLEPNYSLPFNYTKHYFFQIVVS